MGLTSVLGSGRQGHGKGDRVTGMLLSAGLGSALSPTLVFTPQASLPRGPVGKPHKAGRGPREKEKGGASAGPRPLL